MEVSESYRVLELEIGASRAAVDAAYCRLLEKWHPDRVTSGEAEAIKEAQRMVQAINDAYHVLAKISPNTTRQPEPPTFTNSEPGPAAAEMKVLNPGLSGVAPKSKPKLVPLSPNQPSLGHQIPPPPPPPPETWPARTAPGPIPATPPPTTSPQSPAPKSSPNPPPSSQSTTGAVPTPPLTKESPASPSSLQKPPGLYDSLFPAGTPLRRFGLVIIVAAVALVFLLGKCAFSGSSKRKEVQGPDPLTTGRLVAKSNLAEVMITAERLAAPGDVTTASFSGTTDRAMSGLPPGRYSVTAHVDGWPDVRNEVAVDAQGTSEVTMNFPSGSLRLDSDPAGAVVRMGATVLGRTPVVIPRLPPGECQLSLEYPFWPMVNFKSTIKEGVEATGSVRLPHGKLTIETTPPGATVSQGKRFLGHTPLTLEQFPAGARKLTLQAKDFPALELSVNLEDHGEVKIHPALGSAFPLLDPTALLRSVWVVVNPDQIAPPSDGITGPFQSRNGIVKNLNRKLLFENYMDKRYHFSAVIKSYDPASGRIEFVDQQNDLTKFRVTAILSTATRNDPETIAQLTKGASFALYGRLTAVEEPRWPSKVITFELFAAEPLR